LGRLKLGEPQDDVAVRLAGHAYGASSLLIHTSSSQIRRSPFAFGSSSYATVPNGSAATMASKASTVMAMRIIGLI